MRLILVNFQIKIQYIYKTNKAVVITVGVGEIAIGSEVNNEDVKIIAMHGEGKNCIN